MQVPSGSNIVKMLPPSPSSIDHNSNKAAENQKMNVTNSLPFKEKMINTCDKTLRDIHFSVDSNMSKAGDSISKMSVSNMKEKLGAKIENCAVRILASNSSLRNTALNHVVYDNMQKNDNKMTKLEPQLAKAQVGSKEHEKLKKEFDKAEIGKQNAVDLAAKIKIQVQTNELKGMRKDFGKLNYTSYNENAQIVRDNLNAQQFDPSAIKDKKHSLNSTKELKEKRDVLSDFIVKLEKAHKMNPIFEDVIENANTLKNEINAEIDLANKSLTEGTQKYARKDQLESSDIHVPEDLDKLANDAKSIPDDVMDKFS